MEMFLAIIGGLAIAFMLAVAVLFIWLRWKILRIAERAAETVVAEAVAKPSSVPPFRIKLKQVPIDWEAPDRVEELAEPLRTAQFTEVGTFIAAAADLRLNSALPPRRSGVRHHL